MPFSWSDDDEDVEFEMSDRDTLESLVAEYDVACGGEPRCRGGPRTRRPDPSAVGWLDGARPSLRWVYVHMIEETARHNGHLDIYRELLDGSTDRDT